MDNPPLKLNLPSDIAAAFCAVLSENGISYSFGNHADNSQQDGRQFVVNSADDLKEIAIAIVESKPLWGVVATAIWAFARRHKHKTVYIEKDGYKFKASGMSQGDLSKAISDAKNITITENDRVE